MQNKNQILDVPVETEELDSLICATCGLHNPMYSDFDNVCECAHEEPPCPTNTPVEEPPKRRGRGPGKKVKPVVEKAPKEPKVRKVADPEYNKKYYRKNKPTFQAYEKSRNDIHAHCELCACEVVRKHLQRHNRSKRHVRIVEVMELKKMIDDVMAEHNKNKNIIV